MAGVDSIVNGSCVSCSGDQPADCTSATCESGHSSFEAGECARDIDCAGVWSTCGAACADKTFSVATASSGAGAACEAADGSTAACVAGDGECAASFASTIVIIVLAAAAVLLGGIFAVNRWQANKVISVKREKAATAARDMEAAMHMDGEKARKQAYIGAIVNSEIMDKAFKDVYDQRVMDKAWDLQERGVLTVGCDRAGSSTAVESDKALFEVGGEANIRQTKWFYGYVTGCKASLKLASQNFSGVVVVVCIQGGPITQIEAKEMPTIIADAKKDAEMCDLETRFELSYMSYRTFLDTYDRADEDPSRKVVVMSCPELGTLDPDGGVKRMAEPHANAATRKAVLGELKPSDLVKQAEAAGVDKVVVAKVVAKAVAKVVAKELRDNGLEEATAVQVEAGLALAFPPSNGDVVSQSYKTTSSAMVRAAGDVTVKSTLAREYVSADELVAEVQKLHGVDPPPTSIAVAEGVVTFCSNASALQLQGEAQQPVEEKQQRDAEP